MLAAMCTSPNRTQDQLCVSYPCEKASSNKLPNAYGKLILHTNASVNWSRSAIFLPHKFKARLMSHQHKLKCQLDNLLSVFNELAFSSTSD